MDSLLPDAPERNDTANRPLDRSARAAVTALARALEVFDRPAARRAALRAHLADRIAVAAGTPIQDRVDAITGSIHRGRESFWAPSRQQTIDGSYQRASIRSQSAAPRSCSDCSQNAPVASTGR